MKKIIIIIAAALTAQNTFAQISIAPEAGINLSNLTTKDDNGNSEDFSSKVGLRVGAYVNIPVSHGFFIQPGLLYSMKGAQQNGTESLLGFTVNYKLSLNMNYLEVPLNIGYDYSLGNAGGIFVTAGPYLGYGLSGKAKTSVKITGMPDQNDESDIKFGSGNDEAKRIDYGLNFGAGYRTPFGVYARAQYGLGLANISNGDGDASIKHKGWALSLGYAFKI
ncbi:PorT family protein [Taibaiella lutea]|uniref:PorT family protein n=1 Tax=Taibaiella lutea TaxID=2608001 RepID=A0A5M6CMX8_9BACT|nr:porin family protein [Taibaiella lutea]KAA5536397.1 PorT family protein [Taibaiella lutea]